MNKMSARRNSKIVPRNKVIVMDEISRTITPIFALTSSFVSEYNDLVRVKTTRCGTCCGGDYTTIRDRRSQLLKIVTASIVSGLLLLLHHAIYLADTVETIEDKQAVETHASHSLEIGTLVHFTQLERGATVLYLSSGRDPIAGFRLQESYQNTDDAIDRLSKWLPLDSAAHFRSRDSYKRWIRQYRVGIFSSNSTVKDVIDFYTAGNYLFIDLITNNFKVISYMYHGHRSSLNVQYFSIISGKEIFPLFAFVMGGRRNANQRHQYP